MEKYIEILKNILKNFNDDDDFILIIKTILIKIFDMYYLERNIQLYNIDNLFKKYNTNMYNLLKQKYILTESKKLIFKKHVYDKREYIIKLLKNNDIVLNKNETYSKIANEILKKENIRISSYVKDFVKNRIITENKISFEKNDNYYDIHQD